jgi:hypothetical protein
MIDITTPVSVHLHVRTLFVRVRTEDAAVPFLWRHDKAAFFAFINNEAAIGGHRFFAGVAAFRAGHGCFI